MVTRSRGWKLQTRGLRSTYWYAYQSGPQLILNSLLTLFSGLNLESEPSRQICILTSSSIICAWSNKLRLAWDASFSEVGTFSLDENGIRVLDRNKYEIGFIIVTEQSEREWFYGQISKYVLGPYPFSISLKSHPSTCLLITLFFRVIAAHNALKRLEYA